MPSEIHAPRIPQYRLINLDDNVLLPYSLEWLKQTHECLLGSGKSFPEDFPISPLCTKYPTQEELYSHFLLVERYVSEIRNLATADEQSTVTSGFSRVGDTRIVARLCHEISVACEIGKVEVGVQKLDVFELGAGSTLGMHASYGSPWLARLLQLAFANYINVTATDLEPRLDRSTEDLCFGLQVKSDVNYQDSSLHFTNADFIFSRHLVPLAESTIDKIKDFLRASLVKGGNALVFFDGHRQIIDESAPALSKADFERRTWEEYSGHYIEIAA